MSLFSLLLGTQKQQAETIEVLNKSDFKEAIAPKNIQLVDVRTPKEFENGHIKKALNIDFFNKADFIEQFNKLDKNKAVYVYCRSGNRSAKAARRLDSIGFKKIYDLQGGYLNWTK